MRREEYEVSVDDEVRSSLQIPMRAILLRGADIGSRPEVSEGFVSKVREEVRRRHTLESIKSDRIFRAYRDFYWRIGIDPTKVRPSSEALVRRMLQNKPIPRINPFVDVCNLVSALTSITFSVLDFRKLWGSLRLTWSKEGEPFLGIGFTKTETLTGRKLVMRDNYGVVSIYPYRDSERTKVDRSTRDVLIVLCGVTGIRPDDLLEAEIKLLEAIETELFR